MTFSLHDSINPNGVYDWVDHSPNQRVEAASTREEIHIVREKLKIPDVQGFIERPRLNAILNKSIGQFPATLISGRAGTGKTAVAASFAAGRKNVSWYTVESTDSDWAVFSRYFSASADDVAGDEADRRTINKNREIASQNEIAGFLIRHFSRMFAAQANEEALIVLDDIHHIFDAVWFDDFFHLLLYSLPPESHLLLLCRSRPPSPLWRLRSKQMLNVLDEKVIAFTIAETQALFARLDVSKSSPERAHRDSFGRVSRLLQFVSN